MRILLAEEPPKTISFEVPSWGFIPDSEFGQQLSRCGNVICRKCLRSQSYKNKYCIQCCEHEVLRLTTERLESQHVDGIDILAVVCEKCGKHYAQEEWEELFGRRLVRYEEK